MRVVVPWWWAQRPVGSLRFVRPCVLCVGSLRDLKSAIKTLFALPQYATANCRPFAFRVADDEEVRVGVLSGVFVGGWGGGVAKWIVR